jgi:DNA-binding CsgD family transcriptional regulator
VLKLLSHGDYYKEIADALGVSVHTVATHVHHIYEKLHVRSRARAIAKYTIPPEPREPPILGPG